MNRILRYLDKRMWLRFAALDEWKAALCRENSLMDGPLRIFWAEEVTRYLDRANTYRAKARQASVRR